MIKIGVLGDIGSGKSFVAKKFGYPVFNADHEVHKIYKNDLRVFNKLKKPILVGVSRKSMIYNILNSNAKNALNGTSVIHTLALLKKINILRVHDVKEAMECIKIIKFAESIK